MTAENSTRPMTADGASAGQSNRLYYLALLAIIAFGVLIRVFHFRLAMGCDDQVWLITSCNLGEAYLDGVRPVFYGRILWRVLLGAWGAVFGSTLESSAVLMFVLSCTAVFFIAEAARLAFGPVAGLVAAAIHATHPINVVFDVLTVPDGLAVAMLAAALLLFVKYLRSGRIGWLLGAGALVGLSYSVKDYYILAAAPLGLCVLLEKVAWGEKLRRAALFSLLVLAGLSVDFALHAWESGNPLAHVQNNAGYAERIEEWRPNKGTGVRRLHALFWERATYFPWLLVDGGVLDGFLFLWGSLYLALTWKRRPESRMLLMTAAVFFAFLLMMPTKLSPLTFVEMQPRYLTILFPMLAVGGGAACGATLGRLPSSAVRTSLAAALVAGFVYNVFPPNTQIDHHRAQEFTGIRKVLENAGEQGVEELVLPQFYDLFLPDRYRTYGVEFTFRDVEDAAWFREAPNYLKGDAGRAVFLPVRPFPKTDRYLQLLEHLQAEGCVAGEVRVPETSYRAWLYRVDLIDANDQPVGWICRYRPEPAAAETP